jgi:hypothetical protein
MKSKIDARPDHDQRSVPNDAYAKSEAPTDGTDSGTIFEQLARLQRIAVLGDLLSLIDGGWSDV